MQPVIFTGIANDHRLAREEIFGPVTCVIQFKDYEDAIAQANDTDYGLAATIWTRDLKTALDATQRLEAGLVQVNQNMVVQANMSYGGMKQSGLGKEASLEAMLEHFTQQEDDHRQSRLHEPPGGASLLALLAARSSRWRRVGLSSVCARRCR